MKNGPPDEGGPGKGAQSKSIYKNFCAKSPLPASPKSRRLPPEILSARARSKRRAITLPRILMPKPERAP